MKSKILFPFTVLLLLSYGSVAQKIKYRDVFALLEKKQYDAAEPMLKQYLETAPENPNAYLFMGIIAMDKFSKMPSADPQALQVKDLALRSLKKAQQGMTKKEVSKNEAYYEMYRRRNIRSGVVEVNYDDVIADIEKRIALLTAGPQ